jgi:hypothetical protein
MKLARATDQRWRWMPQAGWEKPVKFRPKIPMTYEAGRAQQRYRSSTAVQLKPSRQTPLDDGEGHVDIAAGGIRVWAHLVGLFDEFQRLRLLELGQRDH